MKSLVILVLLLGLSACKVSTSVQGTSNEDGQQGQGGSSPGSSQPVAPLSFERNGSKTIFNNWAEAFVIGKNNQGLDIVHIRFLQESSNQYLTYHGCGDRFNFATNQGYKEYFSVNVLAKAGAFTIINNNPNYSDILSKPYIAASSYNGNAFVDFNSGVGSIDEVNDLFISGKIDSLAEDIGVKVSGQFKAFFCGAKAAEAAAGMLEKNFRFPVVVPIKGNDGQHGTASIRADFDGPRVGLAFSTSLSSAKEFWQHSELLEYRGGRLVSHCSMGNSPQVLGELTEKGISYSYLKGKCYDIEDLQYGAQKFALAQDSQNYYVSATFRQTMQYSHTMAIGGK